MSTTAVTQAAAVSLAGVSKVYGRGGSAVRALDQVSLTAAPGEFTCLIGASGCGKSTLLSLVAGLDRPTSGDITVHGRVALMFQEPGLFPWLTAGAQRRARAARPQGAARRAQGADGGAARRGCSSAASPPSGRTSCPAACASGSRSPAPWRRTPTCC